MADDWLLWVDIETTGLDPELGKILEVGIAVTDRLHLTYEVGESHVINPVPDVEAVRSAAHPTVVAMHDDNGLWADAAAHGLPIAAVENLLLDFVRQWGNPGEIPMCGSSVHFDRAWLRKHMPRLERFFHYRNVDVSTFKEAFRCWLPSFSEDLLPKPDGLHRALADLGDSIREMQWYRNVVMNGAGWMGEFPPGGPGMSPGAAGTHDSTLVGGTE